MPVLTQRDPASPADDVAEQARPRSVVHASAAFGAGMLMALGVPWLGVVVLAGPLGVALVGVVLVAGSATVFGVIGAEFRGRSGWWSACTGLAWLAAVIVFWGLGFTTGTPWGLSLAVGAAAGAVAAGCALLSWRGVARIAGASVLVLVVGIAAVWSVSATATTGSSTNHSPVSPPFTTDVPGYTADDAIQPDGATSVLYRSVDHAFLLSSEPFEIEVCGAPIDGPAHTSEVEQSCTAVADRWYRASAGLQEVAVVRGGWVVRATAEPDVPLGDLENAVAMALPQGAEWTTDAP